MQRDAAHEVVGALLLLNVALCLLCADLNDTSAVFPGTALRLRHRVSANHSEAAA